MNAYFSQYFSDQPTKTLISMLCKSINKNADNISTFLYVLNTVCWEHGLMWFFNVENVLSAIKKFRVDSSRLSYVPMKTQGNLSLPPSSVVEIFLRCNILKA